MLSLKVYDNEQIGGRYTVVIGTSVFVMNETPTHLQGGLDQYIGEIQEFNRTVLGKPVSFRRLPEDVLRGIHRRLENSFFNGEEDYECDACGKIIHNELIKITHCEEEASRPRYRELYDYWWQHAPNIYIFCSEDCERRFVSSEYTEFYYDFCEECGREISFRWPDDGYTLNFNIMQDCSLICKGCIEEKAFREVDGRF